MTIDEKALQHWIENFYGYGSWDARIWFVGYEEGGGDTPEEVAERVNYFFENCPDAGSKDLCDIRELYQRVRWTGSGRKSFTTQHEYRFGPHAVQNSIWKNLAAFVRGYNNMPAPDFLTYQREVFASLTERNEAWLHLYPLPAPHNHAWYYSWLDMPTLSFIKSRAMYEQALYQQRIGHLLSNLRMHKPEVVMMYGMNNVNALKASVQEIFPEAKFRLVKSVKQKIPQHHIAEVGTSRLLITTQIPALRHNRIETGFDWEEMGRLTRQESHP